MISDDRLLRRTEVEEIVGLSRSSIYRLKKEGLFPEPIRIGLRAVRWWLSDIQKWLSTRPRAT